ncbi:MAG: hypothetical protein IKV76_02880 [Clostridia bacterium]|nr:hypothetical protein [Clostridia bacterium]
MMNCIIGLDIGTSAVKGVIMSEDGSVLMTKQEKFTYFGEENQHLINAEDYCNKCFSVIKQLADFVKGTHTVSAICSCCASGNLLLLDDQDMPLIPIIGWQTTVTEEEGDRFFTKEEQNSIYETVGWPFILQFPEVCLAAIKEYRSDLLEKAKTVTMSGEYLNFKLTGKWGLSYSAGTPFYLINQAKGEYDSALLNKLGIADKFLPPLYDKGTVLGTLTKQMAEELGLSEDTKVVLGSFDHPSGALGAGVFEQGQMLLSCGTSWVELFPVPSREFALATNGLVDRFMLKGEPYCAMKSLTSVNVKIEALRRHYFGNIELREFDALAIQGEPGCKGLKFDFTDSDLTKGEGFEKKEIARAIIEAAANLLKDNLDELKECGLKAEKITAIGGITNSAECVEIISQVLGIEITVVNGQSAGAVGACLLGGVGVGIFEDEKSAFNIMYNAKK